MNRREKSDINATHRNMKSAFSPSDTRRVVDLLHAENCSCVILDGSAQHEPRIFRERGVKDLFRLLHEEPESLRGAFVADKVVGKGAAALMILGGIAGLYADVISSAAAELFRSVGIEPQYGREAPHIINRAGTDICPVEKLCADCRTAEECLPLIADFIRGGGVKTDGK